MLFIGDDWAEGHHDVVVQDENGKTLARRRLPEGMDGIARFHELAAAGCGEDAEPDPAQVVVVIETDRGPWVKALAAAGYRVYGVNPKQAARHKEAVAVRGRRTTSSTRAPWRTWAGPGGTRSARSPLTAILPRLSGSRPALTRSSCGSAPGTCCGCGPLCGSTSPPPWMPMPASPWRARTPWSCWGRPPDPASAARLTVAQVTAALRRAGRRGGLEQRARDIQAALRAPHLAQPAAITEAYAASVRAQAAVITALNEQARIMEAKVSELFRRHPDAGVYLSQPGIGDITGARILGEFGDDPGRYATAKARKNYAGTSPLTIQSGKKRTVHARYIRNRHLIDALHAQALSSLTASPGARAFYDELRARGLGHDDAMRRVAGRLTGILHGCAKTGTRYDEAAAWSHRREPAEPA